LYLARSFLEASGFRLHEALQKAYSDHVWQPWQFEIAPQGFWTTAAGARQFFEWIRNDEPMEVLYELSMREIVKRGGQGLMQQTGSSVLQALKMAYPEHNFQPHRFKSVPKHHWESLENQRALFDDIFKQLQFKEMSDWYSITIETLRKMKGTGECHSSTSS
jgi:hypothetical protein